MHCTYTVRWKGIIIINSWISYKYYFSLWEKRHHFSGIGAFDNGTCGLQGNLQFFSEELLISGTGSMFLQLRVEFFTSPQGGDHRLVPALLWGILMKITSVCLPHPRAPDLEQIGPNICNLLMHSLCCLVGSQLTYILCTHLHWQVVLGPCWISSLQSNKPSQLQMWLYSLGW